MTTARASELIEPPPDPPLPVVAANVAAVCAALDTLSSPLSTSDFDLLEAALHALASVPDGRACTRPLLRLLERCPWPDGAHSFWTVVHALEHYGDYEEDLVESVRRAPGEFNLLMINRLLNGGTREVGGISLIVLLEEISESAPSEPARAEANRYLRYQRERRS